MRIAILRADLSQPIYLADLEQISRADPALEPLGQTRYITRPSLTTLGAILNQLPVYLNPTPSLALPVTFTGGTNNVLRLRTATTDSYTVVTIAPGTYSTKAALLTALNTALAATPWQAVSHPSAAGAYINTVVLASRALGPGSRIELDTVANGSNANTAIKYPSAGGNFTLPTAASLLTTLVPVGGPANVGQGPINTAVGLVAQTSINGQIVNVLILDIVAPRFVDTDVAIKSVLVGNLAKYASASFNPDPTRRPAVASGAAMALLDDTGTALTYTLPTLTNAQVNVPGAGQVTLTGTGLAGKGTPNAEVTGTVVKFFTAPNTKSLSQTAIIRAGGTVSSTSIVIPASLLVGLGLVAGVKVQVRYTTLASNVFTLV